MNIKPNSKEESAAVTFMMCEVGQNYFQLDSLSYMFSRSESFNGVKTFSGSVACASKNNFKNRSNRDYLRNTAWK